MTEAFQMLWAFLVISLCDVSCFMLQYWHLIQQHNTSIFKVLINVLWCESYYTLLFITCLQLGFLLNVD